MCEAWWTTESCFIHSHYPRNGAGRARPRVIHRPRSWIWRRETNPPVIFLTRLVRCLTTSVSKVKPSEHSINWKLSTGSNCKVMTGACVVKQGPDGFTSFLCFWCQWSDFFWRWFFLTKGGSEGKRFSVQAIDLTTHLSIVAKKIRKIAKYIGSDVKRFFKHDIDKIEFCYSAWTTIVPAKHRKGTFGSKLWVAVHLVSRSACHG